MQICRSERHDGSAVMRSSQFCGFCESRGSAGSAFRADLRICGSRKSADQAMRAGGAGDEYDFTPAPHAPIGFRARPCADLQISKSSRSANSRTCRPCSFARFPGLQPNATSRFGGFTKFATLKILRIVQLCSNPHDTQIYQSAKRAHLQN